MTPSDSETFPLTRSSESERLAPGTAVGEYLIEAHVGAGAMGDVYRARHPVLGKRVAIKVIKRNLAGSPEALARFVREARAVNRIDHPNVVDVFAMGQLGDGRLWLAMSFLDGESLGKRLRRLGPVSLEELPQILRPVCEALEAAHEKGVIHRDLKTENIFVSAGAPLRVHVLDFGIAKVLADVAAEGQNLTAEGAWVGTPAYMAPEQWQSQGVSPRTDVYALGVVVWEMLTGRPPFSASSLPGLMEQHFRAEPPALSTPTGGLRVPQALEDALRRALAKKPEDRPAGALAFLAAIEAALGTTAGGTLTPPAPPPRRHAFLFAGVAVGLGTAGLVAALLLGRGQARPSPGLANLWLVSKPSGVEVSRDGHLEGKTPLTLRAPAGAELTLQLSRVGFHPATRTVELRPDGELDVSLAPLAELDGVWRIPDGQLRRLEHGGDHVVGYTTDGPLSTERRFLRRFELLGQEGERLVFGAAETQRDARLPDAPSCRFELATEYRFDAPSDRLEQRRERVEYEVRGGECVARGGGVLSKTWTEWEACERLARGGLPQVAESRAGAPISAPPANVVSGADEALPPVKPVVAEPDGKLAPKKFAPQEKLAPPLKKPAPTRGKGSLAGDSLGARNLDQRDKGALEKQKSAPKAAD